MGWECVTVEKDGPVAVVRIDRGDGLNAMSAKLLRELTEVAKSFEDDLETTAIVLTGTDRAFCAGRDLRDPEIESNNAKPMLVRRRLAGGGARLCQVWEDLEALTICAVEGFAIGAGLALSLALDVRVMGENAHFRAPEVALGLSMSWGSIPRLINLVGPARAKQILILSDQRVGSADAAAWGLVQDVTPDGHAVVRALEIARAAAEMPPLTVRMTKQAVNAVANATARASIYMDTEQVILSGMTGDHKEAVAAFKEKRKPRFSGE
jgi:enoyl-CoA hydratase